MPAICEWSVVNHVNKGNSLGREVYLIQGSTGIRRASPPSLALKMAVCRLQNVMNMYDVDLTAQGISFVYMVDQSQIAGTEAACWPCRDRALHKELARALALVYE